MKLTLKQLEAQQTCAKERRDWAAYDTITAEIAARPKPNSRRKQRRQNFQDRERLDWLEVNMPNVLMVRTRMRDHVDTLREAIDHFMQDEHADKLEEQGASPEVVSATRNYKEKRDG